MTDTVLTWIAEELLKLPKQEIRGLGPPWDADVYELSMGSQNEWLEMKEFVKAPYSTVIKWLVIEEMERRGFEWERHMMPYSLPPARLWRGDDARGDVRSTL